MHASSGSQLLSSPPLTHPGPDPRRGILAQASCRCELSSPHEPTGRTVYPIRVLWNHPHQAFRLTVMTHLLAPDPQERD